MISYIHAQIYLKKKEDHNYSSKDLKTNCVTRFIHYILQCIVNKLLGFWSTLLARAGDSVDDSFISAWLLLLMPNSVKTFLSCLLKPIVSLPKDVDSHNLLAMSKDYNLPFLTKK